MVQDPRLSHKMDKKSWSGMDVPHWLPEVGKLSIDRNLLD